MNLRGDKAIVLGIDPGIANLGLARISMNADGQCTADAIKFVKTNKATKKELVALRVSADDVRRASTLWDGMIAMVERIDAIAYEVYQPFPGKGANGIKVGAICGMAMALGFSLKVPVYAVRPEDIKHETLGRRSGTKTEVREALYKRISGLRDQCSGIAKSHLEHVSDAAAVALIGLKIFAGY